MFASYNTDFATKTMLIPLLHAKLYALCAVIRFAKSLALRFADIFAPECSYICLLVELGFSRLKAAIGIVYYTYSMYVPTHA